MRAIGLLATALLVACAHGSDGEARTTTITSSAIPLAGYPLNPEMRLAGAICHRELQCRRIGDGGRWADEGACVRSVSIRVGAELASWDSSCSPGATRARYNDCAASLTEEPCSTVVDRETGASLCPGTTDCTE